jgi:hypothetical protein
MGSGINSTFRQIGIATGIAAYGAIFQSSLASKIPDGPPGDVLAFAHPTILGPGRREEFLSAYAQSMNELLVIAAVVAFAGAVCALVLVRPRDFVAHGAQAGRGPEAAEAPEPARA